MRSLWALARLQVWPLSHALAAALARAPMHLSWPEREQSQQRWPRKAWPRRPPGRAECQSLAAVLAVQ
eukprot:629113-Alexandrium_andersonii.AAC.1